MWNQFIIIGDRPIQPILNYLHVSWYEPHKNWIEVCGKKTNILFIRDDGIYYYVGSGESFFRNHNTYIELIIPEVTEEETILNTNTNTNMSTFNKIQAVAFFENDKNIKAIKKMKENLDSFKSMTALAIKDLNAMNDKVNNLSNPLETALQQDNFESIATMIKEYWPLLDYMNTYRDNTILTIGKKPSTSKPEADVYFKR